MWQDSKTRLRSNYPFKLLLISFCPKSEILIRYYVHQLKGRHYSSWSVIVWTVPLITHQAVSSVMQWPNTYMRFSSTKIDRIKKQIWYFLQIWWQLDIKNDHLCQTSNQWSAEWSVELSLFQLPFMWYLWEPSVPIFHIGRVHICIGGSVWSIFDMKTSTACSMQKDEHHNRTI